MEFIQTVNNTKRLFLYRSELPTIQNQLSIVFVVLDNISIWGGPDKNENQYISWEFSIDFSIDTIKMILNRLNCKIIEK